MVRKATIGERVSDEGRMGEERYAGTQPSSCDCAVTKKWGGEGKRGGGKKGSGSAWIGTAYRFIQLSRTQNNSVLCSLVEEKGIRGRK